VSKASHLANKLKQLSARSTWGDISPSLAEDLGWAGIAASGAGLGTYLTDDDKKRSILGRLHHVALPAVAAAGGVLGGRSRFGALGGLAGGGLGLGGVLALRGLKPEGDAGKDRAARAYLTLLETSLGATLATAAGLKGTALRRYADNLGDDTALKRVFRESLPEVHGAPISGRLSKEMRGKMREGMSLGRVVTESLDSQLGSPHLGQAAIDAGGVHGLSAKDYGKALGKDLIGSLAAPVVTLPAAYVAVAHNDHLDRREEAHEGSMGDKLRWAVDNHELPSPVSFPERFKVWKELVRD